MPATKAYNEKAEHVQALLKLNPNLTEQELSDATGVSISSARRIKRATTLGVNIGKPLAEQQPNLDEQAILDFAESPDPIEDTPKNEDVVSKGKKALFGLLGMSEPKKEENKVPEPIQTKLNKRQQEFVTHFAPALSLGFVILARWMWVQFGDEYEVLAPDDKVAQQIVEPLVRIYARHSTFVTSMSPDTMDGMQSMFALVAYIFASQKRYHQMKAEKKKAENYEPDITPYEPYSDGYREYKPETPRAKNGTNHSGGRQPDISERVFTDASPDDTSNGHNGIEHSNLTSKQQREMAALSQLARKDYEHRARRSGII